MADRRTYQRRDRTPPTPRGWGGVRVVGGRIVDVERNPELKDELWPTVAEQMIRTDDAVQSGVEAVLGTLLSARWTVAPGDPESPFSRRLAADLSAMLGLGTGTDAGMMRRGWEAVIEQLATAELIGFSVGEPVWRYEPGFGVILEDIEDRAQSSIRRWITERGLLIAVEQAPVMEDGAVSWGTPIRIPSDQLVVVSRGKAGNNWPGRGLLRGVFSLWRLKGHLIDMMSIAAERSAVGVPWLKHDWKKAEVTGVSRADFDENLESTRDALDSLVAQARHWVESGPGVELGTIGGDLDVGKAFVPGLEYCDRGILRGLLVQFLALGMSDASGSRALGEVTESFFRRTAAQGLDRIAAAFNGPGREGCPNGVIGRWVAFNHGPVASQLLPRLGHAGLTVAPILQLAQSLGLDLKEWLPATPERRAILSRELQLPADEGQE